MKNIIQKRNIWFTFSCVMVTVAVLVMVFSGLKFGIDFTGGSLIEFSVSGEKSISVGEIEEIIVESEPSLTELRVQETGEGSFIIRTANLSEKQHENIILAINNALDSPVTELRFESIGPVLGEELKRKALEALITAIIVIILYIAWSFRKVSEPVQSWKYGIGAIIALTHDVIIVTGVYSLISIYMDIRIDALFVTALLVILGYSVNDTIVVYDRIRENVLKDISEHTHETFEVIVNKSINETFTRSVNTSLTTMIVLLALFFFGGASIQGFVLALIIGVLIGTYSSIFLASPLLVVWEKFSLKKQQK